MSLPAVLYVKDLRRLLDGWNPDRVRHFLIRNQLALFENPSPPKKQRVVYTTPVLIAERMPDAFAAMTLKWDQLIAGEKFNPDDFADLEEVE